MSATIPLLKPAQLDGWRLTTVSVLCGSALLVAMFTFWHYDWKYSLPTPRPNDLAQPALVSRIELPPALVQSLDHRPALLYFYNPDCPCSRFTQRHVAELYATFGPTVQFVAVVPETEHAPAGSVELTARHNLPAIVDCQGELARALGIYSTPQAVILTADRELFFRGNFNTSRYCTNRDTQFARRALESLAAGQPYVLPPAAELAYGCALTAVREPADPPIVAKELAPGTEK